MNFVYNPFTMKRNPFHLFALIAAFFVFPCTLLPAAEKPVKVYILAGQSNMQGQGFIEANPKRNDGKGSLEFLVKDPATSARFKHLVDRDGKYLGFFPPGTPPNRMVEIIQQHLPQ